MEESKGKRTRVRMSDGDLVLLETQVIKLINIIMDKYECIHEEKNSFPQKYVSIQNGKKFEFIFSQLGSFTIRPLNEEKPKLHSSPIYYISISKYSDDTFQWEDINGDKINIDSEELFVDIDKQLEYFGL